MMTMVGSPSEPRATALKQGARTILSGPPLAASSHQHSIIFLLHDHFIAVQPRRSLRSGNFSEAIGSLRALKAWGSFYLGPLGVLHGQYFFQTSWGWFMAGLPHAPMQQQCTINIP
jgi:hypothetical protein